MAITADDLRAAVAAGKITEAQAADITALSDARRGVRENLDGLDEPFELFRGFNEIFIVVGLGILYAGWLGVTAVFTSLNRSLSSEGMLFGVIGAVVAVILARYFTVKRRMVAPSIMLSLIFGASAFQFTSAAFVVVFDPESWGWALAAATILVFGYWLVFRVPFTMFMVGAGVFVSAMIIAAAQAGNLEDIEDLFLLSSEGPFAVITILLGIIGLGVALWFDMSDPHRVTRRAQTGFWLHVIAAPAIVNTVALTLFQTATTLSLLVLALFLAALAVFAVVIDRRSFLISGIGYVVALAFTVVDDSGFLIILLLGFGLVFLGANWERLRNRLMQALPDFRGKNRLPPWAPKA